ncbi:hypothetical protein ABL541_003017 [Escherichia coli]
MSKGALYEFNDPDQLKIPLPHKHIASTFNDIMSKDVGVAYVSLLYACPLKTHSLMTESIQQMISNIITMTIKTIFKTINKISHTDN